MNLTIPFTKTWLLWIIAPQFISKFAMVLHKMARRLLNLSEKIKEDKSGSLVMISIILLSSDGIHAGVFVTAFQCQVVYTRGSTKHVLVISFTGSNGLLFIQGFFTWVVLVAQE
ncbi:hypothetical protein O6H91_01G073500 [Diphasiastrum complanatum]|uniref:Uncharacterized protein n=1 Tax=Diphasiastrum complanatum TaxID=34168 RepID=A0ACC2ESB2_DIPCM|nr:hypothetical protein O6H91_01G073500 [Diphasiastrum complanatum]